MKRYHNAVSLWKCLHGASSAGRFVARCFPRPPGVTSSCYSTASEDETIMMAVSRLSKEKGYVGVSEQCTQCGKCSSGCPAARSLDLRPRRIALMAQRGEVEGLRGSGLI